MDTISLKANARPNDTTAKAIRKEGQVPCVIYGNLDNTTIQCEHNDLYRAYAKAGESTIIELDVDGKNVPVLVQAIQLDPITDKIIHTDFYAVDMKKEIDARVPVQFEGESPAVKDLGGILIHPHDHVTVKCLPKDLPHSLTVSLENLKEFGDTISVGDIAVPNGVKIVDENDVVVATVQEKRKEVVEEPKPEEGAEGEKKEGEGEGEKKEGEGEGDKKEEDKK